MVYKCTTRIITRYININYTLTLGKKKLNELSPGERGVVLLVFYLALNKSNLPLIIDQPEDNLDNQSVFTRLVPCIKKAKKNRLPFGGIQVVLVGDLYQLPPVITTEAAKMFEVVYGTNDLYQDVKNVYLQEFQEAQIEYDNKVRKDRRIGDYFTHISKDIKLSHPENIAFIFFTFSVLKFVKSKCVKFLHSSNI